MNSKELIELASAARAVVESYEEEIPGVGEIATDAIDRLRKALDALHEATYALDDARVGISRG